MLIKNYLSVSCNTTTLGTTTGAGAVTTVLSNVSSSKSATPAPTTSASATASGNSDHQGNKTTDDANSSSNRIEKDKSTHARGRRWDQCCVVGLPYVSLDCSYCICHEKYRNITCLVSNGTCLFDMPM